jgi:LPXTG-site transpeptidase (sortase) family protein
VSAVSVWTAGHASAGALRPAEPVRPSVPVGLNIPEIGLHVRGIDHLGVTRSGALETPSLAHVDEVGWYEYGPTPGQRGAAVLAGHVDSLTRQAIFYRLHDLRRGDAVSVRRADGSTVTFTVDEVVRVPKAHFPTEKVYGDPGYPALRLITCGGRFDRATGHYLSNIVVFAHLTATRMAKAATAG